MFHYSVASRCQKGSEHMTPDHSTSHNLLFQAHFWPPSSTGQRMAINSHHLQFPISTQNHAISVMGSTTSYVHSRHNKYQKSRFLQYGHTCSSNRKYLKTLLQKEEQASFSPQAKKQISTYPIQCFCAFNTSSSQFSTNLQSNSALTTSSVLQTL